MNLGKSLAANNRLNKVAIPTILLIILIVSFFRITTNEISGAVIIILIFNSQLTTGRTKNRKFKTLLKPWLLAASI